MARRDYYDPIANAWINERELLARVEKYTVARERAAERLDYLAGEYVEGRVRRSAVARVEDRVATYDAALDALEIQAELVPEPAPEPPPGLPDELRRYERAARQLVRTWGFEYDDADIEWELGDYYSGE